MATLTGNIVANFDQVTNSNGLGTRTVIATLTNTANAAVVVTNTAALEFVKEVSQSTGSAGVAADGDAFTVAGVSGAGTATVTFALQGTGTLDVTVTGHTVTEIATFN